MQNSTFLGSAKRCCPVQAIALFLAVCLLLTGLPFSASAAESDDSDNGYVDLNAKTISYKAGQTLIKEKDFTITTKDMYTWDNGFIILELLAKNTGKEALNFRGEFSVIEGYNVTTSMYQTIRPGNQATIILSIDALPLAAVGIDLIRQLDITFDVVNDKTYETLYDDCSMTIPLGIPINMEYYPYEKCLYEESAFKLSVLGSVQVDYRSSPSLIFLLENNLDGPIFARNDGELSVNNNECNFYVHETADAYTNAVFSVASGTTFFEDISGSSVAIMDFPLQICTSNWNPLIDMRVHLGITRAGKIQQFNFAAEKNKAYETSMGEYHTSKNMFMGMFHNYRSDPNYVATLRKKYPEDVDRFYEDHITPYISELLTLYLANLEDEGFQFGVIERPDLCSEESYVVELTDNGKSVIQVAFTISEFDPKSARIMTLGCATNNFEDWDTMNSYLHAMWMAYDTINIHMTQEKHAGLIEHSETTTSDKYGVMFRGQYDGLGYLYSTSDEEIYLVITPDLSLSFFDGMKVGSGEQEIGDKLNVGDTFYFGSYEQDNVSTNGQEDIQWIVVDEKDGNVLAVAAQALDCQRYHKSAANVTWKNCSLRTWLNNDFYNVAFDKEEKAQICSTEVELKAGKDKVFLLSREEVEVYFPSDTQRQCKASAYAKSQNAYVNSKTGGSWWLLRTVGTKKGYVMSVNSDGTMDYDGGRVESDKGTVRPAIWIRTTD